MALSNNFIPNTSLVFTPRDFSRQMAERQAEDRNAFQNYFKFGLQLHDFDKNQQIANEMKKADPDYKKIDSLAASRVLTPDSSFTNWRWKAGIDAAKQREDDALNRAKLEKQMADEKAARNVAYDINATLGTIYPTAKMTYEQGQQYLNTLAQAEAEAKKYGLTDELARISEIRAKVMEQMGLVPSPTPEPTPEPEPTPTPNPNTVPQPVQDPAYTGAQTDIWSAKIEELLGNKAAKISDYENLKSELKNSGAQVSNDLLVKLNNQHQALIEQERKKQEQKKKDAAREQSILNDEFPPTSDDISFMKKRGYKFMSDPNGGWEFIK